MKKSFTTFSTDEKGIITAHTEVRTAIKYSVNVKTDEITMSRQVLLYMFSRLTDKEK